MAFSMSDLTRTLSALFKRKYPNMEDEVPMGDAEAGNKADYSAENPAVGVAGN